MSLYLAVFKHFAKRGVTGITQEVQEVESQPKSVDVKASKAVKT